MSDSTHDYENLARALRHARGGRSRREVAAESGVAEPTIARYESGQQRFRNVPTKLRRLASYYRWTPNSLSEVLRGGAPRAVPAVPPIPPLPAAARDELIRMVGESEMPAWARGHLLRVLLEGGVADDDAHAQSPAALSASPTFAAAQDDAADDDSTEGPPKRTPPLPWTGVSPPVPQVHT